MPAKKYFLIYLKNFKVYFLSLMMMLSSCEKAIEPDYPDFLLSNEAIFDDSSTIRAALANIYAQLRDSSPLAGNVGGLNVILGLYADELDYYRPDSLNDIAFFNHSVLPVNFVIEELWNNSYTIIYNANAIIEGLQTSPLPDAEKEEYLGEALFLRALSHFYLAQLFGDIPYIKTTDYRTNSNVARMPLETVHNFIEQDLINAKLLLKENSSSEKVTPTKGTASALLAYLYISKKQWDLAILETNAVIQNGMYRWQTDINEVFTKDNPSIIWQLKPEFEGAGTSEAETFISDFAPPYLYALTDNFMADFEPGDLRKEAWTREITDGSNSWFHPYKYKQNEFESISSEYSVLFRLAEMLLIRAEAFLNLGNMEEGKMDLNQIRERAGLDKIIDNNPEILFNELAKQWRYEFFTEKGLRWFHIKRSGKEEQILKPLKIGWKSTDVLFPIPQKELLLNPNLSPQNPGY